MLSSAAIYKEWKSGTPIEELIPEGSSVDFWLRLMRRLDAEGGPKKPKAKRQYTSRATGSRKFNHAAAVIGRAMTELVSRVNGYDEDAADIPFYGEPTTVKTPVGPQDCGLVAGVDY